MADKALEISNYVVSLSGFNVRVKSLNLEKGSVLCVIGPNGGGKTTMLKGIMGIHNYTGTVKIGGQESSLLSVRRQVSYASQYSNLLRGSVKDNISYPLKIRGWQGKEDENKVEKIAAGFSISSLLEKNAGQVSGGEARRISLARALVYEPDLLLLDEPLNNLDKESKKSFLKLIKNNIRERGLTSVYVCHRVAEALALGDRLAFMDNGKIIQEGPIEEVISSPKTEKAAAFLGTENIYSGKVTGWSRGLAEVEAGDIRAFVCSNVKKGNVFLGIRPSDVFIALKQAEVSARNRYKGKVVKVVRKSGFVKLIIDCGLTANVSKQSVDQMGIKEGKEVIAYFKATAAHLMEDGR